MTITRQELARYIADTRGEWINAARNRSSRYHLEWKTADKRRSNFSYQCPLRMPPTKDAPSDKWREGLVEMYGVDVDHAFFIDNVNGDFLDLAMRMGRLLLTVPDVTAPFECYLAHEPSIAKGIAQGNPASLWVAFLFYSWARYAPVTFVEDVFDYSIEQCVNVLDECQTVSRQPERANAIELANLIELINSKFKLRQRVALLAVANSPEMRLPLKDLAAVPELDWVQPFNRAIEGLQRAANKLLRPEGWNLSRNSNDAVIKRHSQKPKAGSRQGKKRKKTGESLDR